jgi:hypothetical protein
MTSGISDQARASSFSGPTASLVRCEATIELGRKLTKELELDQSVDTLGRWMAHYVAELVENAGCADPKERTANMHTCSEAILSLWRHRHELPDGKRPFEELEPILRALKSLDPNNDMPRYFRPVSAPVDGAPEDPGAKSWLGVAEALDRSARILIRYCLVQAAETALDKSVEWVGLAEAAGAPVEIELLTIRAIIEENSILKASDLNEKIRKQLEDRIERLERFTKMATELASLLRQQAQQAKDAAAKP